MFLPEMMLMSIPKDLAFLKKVYSTGRLIYNLLKGFFREIFPSKTK
jgi:flagellar biosynthesis protein FliQ